MNLKVSEKNKGITLTVLVITIAVILILSGVTINAIFADDGLINKSRDLQKKANQNIKTGTEDVDDLVNMLDNEMQQNSSGDQNPTEKPKITDSSLKSDDRTNTDSETVIAKDSKGNQIVVPGGFKIADDSGDTVEKGVVIEDKEGNQFVWIPVSNINADGSNKIIKDDGSEVEITLGRYTFDGAYNSTTKKVEGTGEPTLVQKGSEYAAVTAANVADGTVNTNYKIGDRYYELSDKNRLSNEKGDITATNTTAKDLEAFINKTKANKGFYIARYEASYGSGYNSSGTDTATKFGNAKPLSKVSTANSTSSMDYKTPGTLWNFITQPQAAMVSKNMYSGNNYVESDLINSYAWDTAIVYIQEMGNTNYANANRDTTGNKSLKNTGETGDKVCNIFDMAGNLWEWTTEYSTDTDSSDAFPCTCRGGYYNFSSAYTSFRGDDYATSRGYRFSFRLLLYVK